MGCGFGGEHTVYAEGEMVRCVGGAFAGFENESLLLGKKVFFRLLYLLTSASDASWFNVFAYNQIYRL